MRERLHGYGWYGGIVFIAFAGLFTGVGVPRLWISVLAGGFYGAVLGTAVGHFSSLLGATLNFFIARWFLRGPVIRRMPARLKVWYERFNRNGFKYLLYMRLFPLSNATVTNTVGGVSKMTFPHFIAATFIGYLPLTIVFAIFGSSAAKQNYWQLLIGAAIFVTVLTVEHRLRKRVTAEFDAEERGSAPIAGPAPSRRSARRIRRNEDSATQGGRGRPVSSFGRIRHIPGIARAAWSPASPPRRRTSLRSP